jgi:hypothetical protein
MATTHDIDAAKDRLVDSLSSARDVTVSAVREDIAPAVVAAVGAAREASGPIIAEAASRTGDAVNALRGSDAADALRSRGADAAKAWRDSGVGTSVASSLGQSKPRRRWPILAVVAGVGAGAVAFARQRRTTAGAYSAPAVVPTKPATEPNSAASDSTPPTAT